MAIPFATSPDQATLLKAQELAHVGTWVWDIPGDVVTWSPEVFRLAGIPVDSIDLHKGTFLELVHPDDRERVARSIQTSIETGRELDYDYRIILPGGEVRVHHGRGAIIRDQDGRPVQMVGTVIDITKRARAEQALRKSEQQFRSVFEQSAVGIALTDSDRRFVQVNQAFATLLGYTAAELCEMTFVDVTHPDDVKSTHEMVRHTANGRSFSYEKRYLRKNGATVWGQVCVTRLRHDDGSLDGYMGIVKDITESKLAAEELSLQSEVLQSILDHLPVMVVLFDPAGRPVFMNREMERVYGWTMAEARDMDLLAAVYPDPAEAARARDNIGRGSAVWNDYQGTTRAGKKLLGSWTSMRLSNGNALFLGQDVTVSRAMRDRLSQAQKMEALGQLAGGVAHDFNNLLTIISACASFVTETVGRVGPAADDVKEIVSACNRAAALTRQLLAFSRREMLRPEIVDVNEAVQTFAKTLGRLIGENVQLAVVPGAAMATVQADRHQLEQVVLNLVVNARDALLDGGTITIETRNSANCGDAGPCSVIISVTDDGTGIDPLIRDRIFDPFFTTKPVGKGTGLGLATVHGIVQQSGGRIEVESELGAGASFRVFLPLVCATDTGADQPAAYESMDGAETILLVEDEAALRAVARRVLVGHGYTVLEARHGVDALLLSAKHAGTIDLLITDVVMPEMGGRELATRFRAARPGGRVLYITGYTDDELLRKGILEPGAELLRKPFVPGELARAVRQLLGPAGAVS